MNAVLDHFSFTEGRVLNQAGTGRVFTYEYHIKDHLGNTRVVFDQDLCAGSTTGGPVQETHYYPFGLRLARLGYTTGDDNKYLYNHKELEDSHGLTWYHYGARYYDPQVGRWWSVDPVDEQMSAYVYCANNPLIFIDPDGREITLSGRVIDGNAAAVNTDMVMGAALRKEPAQIKFINNPGLSDVKNIFKPTYSYSWNRKHRVSFGENLMVKEAGSKRFSPFPKYVVETKYQFREINHIVAEYVGVAQGGEDVVRIMFQSGDDTVINYIDTLPNLKNLFNENGRDISKYTQNFTNRETGEVVDTDIYFRISDIE